MSKTQQLKIEIISVIDRLPLDGLKLLAEFVEFLQSKFRLTAPKPTNTVPKIAARPSSRSEARPSSRSEEIIPLRNQIALNILEKWYGETDDKGEAWWDEFEQFLEENPLSFPEREIL